MEDTCYHVLDGKKSMNSKSAYCTQSAVCILYSVCSLQFAFYTDRICIAAFVRASLRSELKFLELEKTLSETILAAMIDTWTVCWRAPEDKHDDRAMIYFIPTEDERKCAAYQ